MTRIIGVAMVKNEADIIETTVLHMLGQGLDEIIVADNLSTDATRSILDVLATRYPISVFSDDDPAYHQARKMTALAERAGEAGADWVVPFDADELWVGSSGTVRQALEACPSNIAAAPMLEHHPRPTLRRGAIPERMPWARHLGFAKVAFRWTPGATLIEGNHNVTGVPGEPYWSALQIHHFPLRSYDQWRRKARQGADAVRLAEWPDDMARQWRSAAEMSSLQLRLSWWRFRCEPRLRYRPVAFTGGR